VIRGAEQPDDDVEGAGGEPDLLLDPAHEPVVGGEVALDDQSPPAHDLVVVHAVTVAKEARQE
jgi:hypothetical protein